MPEHDIDFRRIRPHGGSRDAGFEELASQLAFLESRQAGVVFFRKGIGADGGVECFVRLADGTEIGWQAKYFFELGSSQISQLDKSIGQALKKHPQLVRFVVCLPFNLRDSRKGKGLSELGRWEAWVKRWVKSAADQGRDLAIGLWAANELLERLSRKAPLYEGRLAFWFDETILTPEWFRQRFEVARANLGARYTPLTNIDLPIRRTLHAFCRDPFLIDEIGSWAEKLDERGYRAIDGLRRLHAADRFEAEIDRLESAVQAVGRLLQSVPEDPNYSFPIVAMIAAIELARGACGDCERAVWDTREVDAKDGEQIRHAGYQLRRFSDAIYEALSDLRSDRWQIANYRELLLFGDAGVGKSHLFADTVAHQVERDRPAVLVLGAELIEAEPWSQIVAGVQLQGISTASFLGALDAAGQAAGTRAVIFVDAINERHGIDLWSTRLPGFLQAIAPYPHVAVAVSCRSTYLTYIVPEKEGSPGLARIEHKGFAGRPEAANEYLDRRGIVRMAAPNLVPEFYNPLFLKTCCDFLEKEGRRELPRGLEGVSDLFGFYSRAVVHSVERRLSLDPRRRIVARALDQLAAAFDEGYRGYIPVDAANAVLDRLLPSDGTVERSLLTQLESEGVVAIEPVSGADGEVEVTARFTFERYSDHRIAALLLDRHLDPKDPKASFRPGQPLHEYALGERSFERAGIVEALAIQLPERCGVELLDAIPRGPHPRLMIQEAFLKSLLWRRQSLFTERTLTLLKTIARQKGDDDLVLRTLLAVGTEPKNPFNALFLHGRLMGLSMPERDRTWSVFILNEDEDDADPIETLIAWSLQNGLGTIDDERAELAAILLAWLCSATHRSVRDRATKALAALLAPRLALAARLVERFSSVNDPYVLERVLAGSYGAALQGVDSTGLGELTLAVFRNLFAGGKPPVHALIRDHARGIVELAATRGKLPGGVDPSKARPPHRSPWPLEEVTEADVSGFTQEYSPGQRFRDDIVGSTVNDGDFARYIIDHAVDDWTTLGIEYAGHTREQIFERWRTDVIGASAKRQKLLAALERAAAALRQEYEKSGPPEFKVLFVEPPKRGRKPRSSSIKEKTSTELARLEKSVAAAERRLLQELGESERKDYERRARDHLQADMGWRRRMYHWPPRPDVKAARRWVCKRAHDLGWTVERFGEIDRHLGGHDRMDHRIERIGKKYQWIAFHELLARLGDHLAFKGMFGDSLSVFDGPWQVSRREMDPSLLAMRTNGDVWRQWDRTWWLPIAPKLRPVPPAARILWVQGDDDLIDSESLIRVLDPVTGRSWLVIEEFVSWHQYGTRRGDRDLDRDTWLNVDCLLVRASDRDALVRAMSGRYLSGRDMPSIETPLDGYLGEYPWHPAYSGMEWVEPGGWHGIPVAVQPVATRYLAERGGYDYSIAETIVFKLPSPSLLRGMGLHLSNGRDLAYADNAGVVRFFDPSARDVGPSAALVDEEQFVAFLEREGLAAVWIINGEKNAYGGRSHDGGYGGSRFFTSVYSMDGKIVRRGRYDGSRDATPEQLKKLFEGEDGEMPQRDILTGSLKKIADTKRSKGSK